MKTTPRAAFVSVSKKLKSIERSGRMDELRRYVESAAYHKALGRIVGTADLAPVLALYAKAYKACDARTPLPKPWTVKRATWDAAMVAKFRRAWAKAGSDDGAARLCNITLDAARRARHRYITVAVTTPDRAQAA